MNFHKYLQSLYIPTYKYLHDVLGKGLLGPNHKNLVKIKKRLKTS